MNHGVQSDIPRSAGTGVIHGKMVTCRYTIFQPAVTQWVALGVVSVENDDTPQLAVESAANPKDALVRLKNRVLEIQTRHTHRLDAAAGII
jgi:hypothetical protein